MRGWDNEKKLNPENDQENEMLLLTENRISQENYSILKFVKDGPCLHCLARGKSLKFVRKRYPEKIDFSGPVLQCTNRIKHTLQVKTE